MKITAAEVAYVRSQGLYVTEKCEGCEKIGHAPREMIVQRILSKHELKGKIDDGTPLLRVSTVSGNIRVE